ncbi:HAMP domain-containing methyl-accepting chemotaxis protein [Paenibacillus glufosinatiresistens]|uniref:HAMP domain-containing methyl-accepting chemotaxis protein n=1 Tax=Paenibacillus glufosinatiresistens TaxID=3070657 RepID=UPI00286E7839|nr:methyl-accepting chemotaxis protein [Paenibacillus sp. YX.27]
MSKIWNNMRIGVKLVCSFVVVALLAAVVGGVGIVNLKKVDRNYTELYQDYGISLGYIGKVGMDFHAIRTITRDIIIDHPNRDLTKLKSRIQELDSRIAENLALFEGSIHSDSTRATLEELKKSLSEYNGVRDKAISYEEAGQPEQALKELYGNGSVPVTDATEAIDALFATKQDTGMKKSDQYSNESNTAITTMFIVLVAAVVLAVLLGVLISRMIGRPIRQMLHAADRIADGDLDVEISFNSTDEIGMLAAAFRRMSTNLDEVMSNIRSASEQVGAGSQQMAESSLALSQGAAEQASAIEQLTASIEEISAQTTQNARNAEQVNGLTRGAMDNAEQGNAQMRDMLAAMEEINESSGSISKIIKAIDEIAFQTNILALNAAVEAARAGQHGKGFAVVAEEVRNLAARSANAAKETTALIENSVKKSEQGTRIAADTAAALERIVTDIAGVAAIMGEVTLASAEQAAGITQINQGVNQLSEVVQLNSATSEESAAASEELAGQAELLREQMERFRLKGEKDRYAVRPQSGGGDLRFAERGRRGGTRPAGRAKQASGAESLTIALGEGDSGKYGL